MEYTIKTIRLESEESMHKKERMISLNRKLRGENRALGGDTSYGNPHDNTSTGNKGN
jgi:hypothetical protein